MSYRINATGFQVKVPRNIIVEASQQVAKNTTKVTGIETAKAAKRSENLLTQAVAFVSSKISNARMVRDLAVSCPELSPSLIKSLKI